jgi:formylglycine-generating enzyme required for sulfatase activity
MTRLCSFPGRARAALVWFAAIAAAFAVTPVHPQPAASSAAPAAPSAQPETLERLLLDVEAQRKALQDIQSRVRRQADGRKAALADLQARLRDVQAELDAGAQADQRAIAEEARQVSAAAVAAEAAQARVAQERQRLAAEAAERQRRDEVARRVAQARQPVIPPGTEKRVALVVGNARYADRPLRNPGNDSALMARTLTTLGFDVQVASDVDRRSMLNALRDFEIRALGADVALFYFAGHGVQVGGANYLIPVNAGIRLENDVPDEAIDAATVLRRIEDSRAKVGLVVLDACRDNPFPGASRSSARGLARMNAPTGTIVAYATAPGSTADDGSGDNGTYTAALARFLTTPGLDVKEIFDRTAQEVERVTNGKQRPREDIGLRGRFALLEAPVVPAAPSVSLMASAEATPMAPDPDVEAWELAKRRDTLASYEAYLQAFPRGRYVPSARSALAGLRVDSPPDVAAPARATQEVINFTTVAAALQGGVEQATAAQAAAAEVAARERPARKPGEVFRDCPQCPEMVVIPAGSALMGSARTEPGRTDDEGPQRTVNIGVFAIGKFEVTQAEWLAVMGNSPSSSPACDRTWFGALIGTAERCPVENVSWQDVQEFLRRLSEKTGQTYRLPSEAEWEYAARAGSVGPYPWGDSVGVGNANCSTCAGRWSGKGPAPVGSFKANAFGLHDMHGNVWEWVQDVWHDNYVGSPSNGSAWVSGGDQNQRVFRGGSSSSVARNLRSANRSRSAPDSTNSQIGFRIAMTIVGR